MAPTCRSASLYDRVLAAKSNLSQASGAQNLGGEWSPVGKVQAFLLGVGVGRTSALMPASFWSGPLLPPSVGSGAQLLGTPPESGSNPESTTYSTDEPMGFCAGLWKEAQGQSEGHSTGERWRWAAVHSRWAQRCPRPRSRPFCPPFHTVCRHRRGPVLGRASLPSGAQGQPLPSASFHSQFCASYLALPLRVWSGQFSESEFPLLSCLSQAEPALSSRLQPPRRPLSKMPFPGPPGPRTAPTSPEASAGTLPQRSPGRLQQLRASLSLRLGSLDPDWLQRCHSEPLDFPKSPSVCSPGLGTKESQPLTSGEFPVFGPSTCSEEFSQGPKTPAPQAAQNGLGSPQPSNLQGKKQKWSENGGSPVQPQQDINQTEPLSEGTRAIALEEDLPGQPVQAQPSQPCSGSSPARTKKAKGMAHMHICRRPAVRDRSNYVRLNMKHKHYVWGGALRGRLLRKQVRWA